MTTGALDGLRVLDLSNQLSGPYCAMLLGDLGADVIKVEHPDGGDNARQGAPHVHGESAPFMTVFTDPHVKAREMAVEVDHARAGRTRVLGIPFKLSQTPGAVRRPAPTLGQHTDEILGQLGYDTAAIADLRARRVV